MARKLYPPLKRVSNPRYNARNFTAVTYSRETFIGYRLYCVSNQDESYGGEDGCP
jgi:hypothetical protein